MNYFKNTNNEIFAYDDEQVNQGYGKDLIHITEQEKDELLAPTPEQFKEQKIAEAKAYLASTDWYIIRYADNGKEVPSDIKIKREEARISIGGINE